MTEKKDKEEQLDAATLKGHTQIVFAFDTTGSMSDCIEDVRKNLKELIGDMAKDIPNLRVGIIAFGDYCDGDQCINTLDITDKYDDVLDFVINIPNTGGGDLEECYELVLHKAQELDWADKKGAFVLIGDAGPHKVGYKYGDVTNELDWFAELDALCEQDITVYAMQCLKEKNPQFKDFWDKVAERADTPLLFLDHFEESAITLGAVARASYGDVHVMSRYKSSASSMSLSASTVRNFASLGYEDVENTSKNDSPEEKAGE